MDIDQFAFNVGAATRKIREASSTYHDAYMAATAEQKANLRHRWLLGHLAGQKISNPERVLSQGKGKGATRANIMAIDRASSDFRYYVVRPVKVKKAESSSKVDPVADLIDAFNALSKAQQKRFLSSI